MTDYDATDLDDEELERAIAQLKSESGTAGLEVGVPAYAAPARAPAAA